VAENKITNPDHPDHPLHGRDNERKARERRERKAYVPPVGPGSKSVPPTGDWRDLPPGLLPKRREADDA